LKWIRIDFDAFKVWVKSELKWTISPVLAIGVLALDRPHTRVVNKKLRS